MHMLWCIYIFTPISISNQLNLYNIWRRSNLPAEKKKKIHLHLFYLLFQIMKLTILLVFFILHKQHKFCLFWSLTHTYKLFDVLTSLTQCISSKCASPFYWHLSKSKIYWLFELIFKSSITPSRKGKQIKQTIPKWKKSYSQNIIYYNTIQHNKY